MELTHHLDTHNITERVGTLHSSVTMGELNNKQREKYNHLDDFITEGMLSAGQKLPKQKPMDWTPWLTKALHIVHYVKLLLWRSRGQPIHQNVLIRQR